MNKVDGVRSGRLHILAMVALWLSASSMPASADCFTTGSEETRQLCQKEFLLHADKSLNDNFSALIATGSKAENRSARYEQRQWLLERNRKCLLLPNETREPDWIAKVLADNKKAECVIEETIDRASFLSFLVRQQNGHPAPFPHSDDGMTYSWLNPNTELDDYLGRVRDSYDNFDINKDGVISVADLATGRLSDSGLQWYLGIKVQPDHPATWDTIAAKATAYFRYFDKNDDGFVSVGEFVLVNELEISMELGGFTDRRSYEAFEKNGCDLPNPSSDAEIILLSYEPTALASVGMHESEVRAGFIKISPGDRPLYVILPTSSPVIWTFEGDVRRLETVVISSMQTGPNSSAKEDGLPMGGAVGLQKSQIFFPAHVNCMREFDEHPSRDSIRRIKTIKDQFGRLPDRVSADRSVAGFSLPDGAVFKSKRNNGLEWGSVRTQVSLFYPGGVVPIDVSQVISSQPVETYSVLPGVAGLRQLVEQGALIPLEGHAIYRVTRKLTLPIGLYGAALAKFIVPSGVPAPDGDPGHSCVISEDGKVLAGICN